MSHPPTAPSSPGPDRIIAMMTAFEQTAALKAALAIGLFGAVAAGADTPQSLAARCGCAERSARILADAFCVYGLIAKADGRYRLAPDAAAFLDPASPAHLGEAARFLASPEKIRACLDDPEGWARRGGPADLAHTAPQSAVWIDFARSMEGMMAPTAEVLARTLGALVAEPRRILDVAAGHGRFGVEAARAFAQSEVTALDWPGVIEATREVVDQAGLTARFTFRPGDALKDPLGEGYDLILVPNFLHHFDPAVCAAFLARARDALEPAGAVAIVEFTPDESRIRPPGPALFALTMLTSTPAGDAYTAGEIQDMCRRAGFEGAAVHPLPPTPQTLILASVRAAAGGPGRDEAQP